ncbi:Uncharacterised protein [Mycobacteroides abscessus subsp. abscessus]|nr:Uncharacterised protein [Mycobacteroides abscessus subsp. abscessus]
MAAKLPRLEEICASHLTLISRRCRSRETIALILREDLAFGFARPFSSNPELDSVVLFEEEVGAVLCKSKYGLRTSIPLQELLKLDYPSAGIRRNAQTSERGSQRSSRHGRRHPYRHRLHHRTTRHRRECWVQRRGKGMPADRRP